LPGRRKICFSVKGEYLEKEWEFGDSGMYIRFVNKLSPAQPWTNHVN
jgi:hypothetical protein